ncbi:DUF998 domain-containing protein [Microtetraspora malaysiensis]|uniref:DUF998 domain-containing protein n=1 Tax=Microtetraspora malaysiensis TaxID=161358 RepID=UPI003D8A072C
MAPAARAAVIDSATNDSATEQWRWQAAPFSLLVFAALAGACFVFARRFAGWGDRGWALYSAATGTLVVIGFFLSGQAFSQTEGLVEIGGLLQRLTITVGWAWLALLAVRVRGEGQSAGEPR